MASHTVALGIAVLAYVCARRWAADRRFAFGTGKINSLAGFGSAVLLGGFAVVMATESIGRLFNPIAIAFDQALVVAAVGLLVNGGSAWLLATTPHGHGHGHDHAHGHGQGDHHHRHDHNLRAAYFHVLADALTSVLAIVALLAGKYFEANWLDPVIGILGALLVARWSYGLLKNSGRVLLDHQADSAVTGPLRQAIEGSSNDRVSDLHVWSIGHGIFAAEVTIISDTPEAPDHYRSLVPETLNIVHIAIEIHQCHAH